MKWEIRENREIGKTGKWGNRQNRENGGWGIGKWGNYAMGIIAGNRENGSRRKIEKIEK